MVLATCEKMSPAFTPIILRVPMTIANTTAIIMAYSAIPCPSVLFHSLAERLTMGMVLAL